MKRKGGILIGFISFWLFLTFFKLAGGIHYALVAPLSENFMPLRLIGLIGSLAGLAQMLLDIPAGRLLDKYGYKKLLIMCTAIFAIGGMLFLFHINTLTIILSIAFSTIGWLFASPGANAYVLSHAERSNSDKFMAYRDVWRAIGIVLSCLVFPLIINSSNTVIGRWITGSFIVALICIICSPRDKERIVHTDNPHVRTHAQRKHVIKNLRSTIQKLNPASVILLCLNLSGAMFYAIIWFVVPLVIAAHPEQGTLLGIGMSMFDFAVVVIGSIICRFVNKFDKKLLIFIGLLLFALMSMLSGMYLGILFLVAAFFATTGDELASLPLRTWLHQLDKDHSNDGLVSGIINFFEDIGWMLGPLLGGLLYTYLGPELTIVIGALPILLTAIVYYVAIKKEVIHLSLFDAPRRPHKLRSKH